MAWKPDSSLLHCPNYGAPGSHRLFPQGVHLCEIVKESLVKLHKRGGFQWREVDVDSDAELRANTTTSPRRLHQWPQSIQVPHGRTGFLRKLAKLIVSSYSCVLATVHLSQQLGNTLFPCMDRPADYCKSRLRASSQERQSGGKNMSHKIAKLAFWVIPILCFEPLPIALAQGAARKKRKKREVCATQECDRLFCRRVTNPASFPSRAKTERLGTAQHQRQVG